MRSFVFVLLLAVASACASSCASLFGAKGPDVAGVVIVTEVGETRGALLTGRPFRTVDMTDAYLLLTTLPPARKTMKRTSARGDDVANIAKGLVDEVAFGACKHR